MKTYLSLLVACFLFACDCQETKPTGCGTENPTENLPWLKSMIESWDSQDRAYTFLYVQQGEYLGQTVFVTSDCCPFCNSTSVVYNCEGESLFEGSAKINQIKNLKVIWKPAGFQCQLQ